MTVLGTFLTDHLFNSGSVRGNKRVASVANKGKSGYLKRASVSEEELTGRKSKKALERTLLVVVSVGTVGVALVYGSLFQHVRDHFVDREAIYGTWVEHNVASYAAEKIEVGQNGIVKNGKLVSSQFDFDGDVLTYQTGKTTYHYRMLNEENTEMQLLSDKRYKPKFRLSGKYKKNIRKR